MALKRTDATPSKAALAEDWINDAIVGGSLRMSPQMRAAMDRTAPVGLHEFSRMSRDEFSHLRTWPAFRSALAALILESQPDEEIALRAASAPTPGLAATEATPEEYEQAVRQIRKAGPR